MHYVVLCILGVVGLASLVVSGVAESVVLLIITGAVPGTSVVLSPLVSFLCIAATCIAGVIALTKNTSTTPLVEPKLIRETPATRRRGSRKTKTDYLRRHYRRLARPIRPKALALRARIAAIRKDRVAPLPSENLS